MSWMRKRRDRHPKISRALEKREPCVGMRVLKERRL
jgi:hypothetical protein